MDKEAMKKELLEVARLLATPIDLKGLTRAGVLERSGKRYRVLDYARLPEHARRQITAMSTGTDGRLLVAFRRQNKQLAQLYEELTGEQIPPLPK